MGFNKFTGISHPRRRSRRRGRFIAPIADLSAFAGSWIILLHPIIAPRAGPRSGSRWGDYGWGVGARSWTLNNKSGYPSGLAALYAYETYPGYLLKQHHRARGGAVLVIISKNTGGETLSLSSRRSAARFILLCYVWFSSLWLLNQT